MKTQASSNLSKSMAQYSAMAMALTGSTNVLGQIVYTDVDPDITSGYYNLDLDNDTSNDFEFEIFNGLVSIFGLTPLNSNAILGSTTSWWDFLNVLNNGQVISSGQSDWIMGWASMCYGSWGNWCGVTDKFAGLRFKIGTNTHYGWVRLDVNDNNFTIKDYAYNATPGESINAGQTTLSVEEFNLKDVKIVSKNNRIELYNLYKPLDYRLFFITGQIIMEGKTEEKTYAIDTNKLVKGVYIIELFDKKSKSTLRNKIVI